MIHADMMYVLHSGIFSYSSICFIEGLNLFHQWICFANFSSSQTGSSVPLCVDRLNTIMKGGHVYCASSDVSL